MERKTNKRKVSSEGIWIVIAIILNILFPVIGSGIDKSNGFSMYSGYYEMLFAEFIFFPGSIILVISYLIKKVVDFKKKKKNLKFIMFLILILIVSTLGGILFKYTTSHKYLQDLDYVKTNTYCENIEDLENVYIKETTSKATTYSLYVETSNQKFKVYNHIANKDNYDNFIEKYKDVKKVRIKYLPHCNRLLEIEPADDTEE